MREGNSIVWNVQSLKFMSAIKKKNCEVTRKIVFTALHGLDLAYMLSVGEPVKFIMFFQSAGVTLLMNSLSLPEHPGAAPTFFYFYFIISMYFILLMPFFISCCFTTSTVILSLLHLYPF